MAEYIEREALIETFEEWKENFEMYPPECSESVVIGEVVQKIKDFPTADVVPKSEVEKEIKNWQELYADTVSKWEKAYEELEIKLENAKADVAREIFEELNKIAKVIQVPAEFIDGCVQIVNAPYICIKPSDYAELKKKYTEGE